MIKIRINDIQIGGGAPLVLIAGPCVVESREMVIDLASEIKEITNRLEIPYIFKASYKKANRTNINSFSTLGVDSSLKILEEVRKELSLPVITDVHTAEEAVHSAEFVDILQIPAFLCRQTDLLIAAGGTGKIVNVKKGQFLAPEDMKQVAEKVASTGNNKILLTERGTTFGYHNLVVDMRSLVIMKETGYPIVMDATHSVQLPSKSNISGGEPKFIKPLAKAAVAVGIDALFLEVHRDPSKALSDASSQLKLSELEPLLNEIKELDNLRIKNFLNG